MENIIDFQRRTMNNTEQQKRISNMEREKNRFYFGLIKKAKPQKNDTGERYTIKIRGSTHKFYDLTFSINSIECSCLDYKFRCKANGIFCKHALYFNKMVLHQTFEKLGDFEIPPEKLVQLVESLEDRQTELDNLSEESRAKILEKISISDECAICLDLLISPELNSREQFKNMNCVQCAQCNNFLHTPCMKIWYEVAKTCPYCRVINTYKF